MLIRAKKFLFNLKQFLKQNLLSMKQIFYIEFNNKEISIYPMDLFNLNKLNGALNIYSVTHTKDDNE